MIKNKVKVKSKEDVENKVDVLSQKIKQKVKEMIKTWEIFSSEERKGKHMNTSFQIISKKRRYILMNNSKQCLRT